MQLHYYGMMERGCSIGCQPKKGFYDFRDTDINTDGFYSIIVYTRQLSLEEEKEYMLKYLGVREPYSTY